jgi:hypothetical protein
MSENIVQVVEELDSHNLGVGALQGDILLMDLKLRPDALVCLPKFFA